MRVSWIAEFRVIHTLTPAPLPSRERGTETASDTAAPPPPPRARDGFTLVEVVISMLIVGVMLVMALTTLGWSARGRLTRATAVRGPALAADLMAEILQAGYEEPADVPVLGREAGESADCRADYDDVDDYDGWSASPPQAKDGSAIASAAGWRRSVSVACVEPDNVLAAGAGDTGLKRVTVIVTDPRGGRTTLVGLRARGSTSEDKVPWKVTYLSSVTVDLQVGSRTDARIASAAAVLNQVPAGQ